jgi:hypothetical protein
VVEQQLQPTTPAKVAVDLLARFLPVIVLEGRDSIPDRFRARNFPRTDFLHVDTLRPYGRKVERFGRGEPDSIICASLEEGVSSHCQETFGVTGENKVGEAFVTRRNILRGFVHKRLVDSTLNFQSVLETPCYDMELNAWIKAGS